MENRQKQQIWRKEDLQRANGASRKTAGEGVKTHRIGGNEVMDGNIEIIREAEDGRPYVSPAERETYGGISMTTFTWIGHMLDNSLEAVSEALPAGVMSGKRFIRLVKMAINNNPEIAKCNWRSIKGCMMRCALLGLEPNSSLGQAWMIPRKNECTLQIGYKGLMELARRTGKVRTITSDVIREKDLYDYAKGIGSYLRHKPALGDRGKAIAYYACWEGFDGSCGFEIMSKEEMDIHREHYCRQNGAWRNAYDAMAKKTVLCRLIESMPMSAETKNRLSNEGNSGMRVVREADQRRVPYPDEDQNPYMESLWPAEDTEFPEWEEDSFPEWEADTFTE